MVYGNCVCRLFLMLLFWCCLFSMVIIVFCSRLTWMVEGAEYEHVILLLLMIVLFLTCIMFEQLLDVLIIVFG